MTRYRLGSGFERITKGAALVVLMVGAGACSTGTAVDEMPTSAVINIEGTTPNPLELIISTDFYEQFNVSTGNYTPVLVTSDTTLITPPFNRTVNIAALGSIYVELYQPEVGTASVNMKVDLDNGEGYEQNANMSDGAQLIYYFVFTNYSI